MGIRILKGGMLTTVQDSGRPGYQSQGFGVSGVMDRRSFKIANLLLDNPEMSSSRIHSSWTNTGIYFRDDHRYHGR